MVSVAAAGLSVAVFNTIRSLAPGAESAIRSKFGWKSCTLDFSTELSLTAAESAALSDFTHSPDSEFFYQKLWVDRNRQTPDDELISLLSKLLREHSGTKSVNTVSLATRFVGAYNRRVDALRSAESTSDCPPASRSAVRRYAELWTDVSRLNRARRLLSEYMDTRETTAHSFLGHLDLEQPIDRRAVYISRDVLVDGDERTRISDILRDEASPRYVILGDPGVGKTTLVEHLASVEVPTECPVVILRLRDVPFDDRSTVLASIRRVVASQVQRELGEDDVADLLNVSQIIVVFDGLDEVAQIETRRRVADWITNFSRAFPIVGVFVTSRATGYDAAPLNPDIYRRAVLAPYSDEQLEEYIHRWFSQVGRPELASSFSRDVSTVSDLRSNPLMVSLLCSLYRAHGSIPTNRRDIYNQCAQLLFERWDRHRQIRVSSSEPEFAASLMREIAYFFYRSQSARGGVQEGQLRRIVSSYIQDYAGADVHAAEDRARDFLGFCAGRAWLLSRTTDARGNHVFGFTHRTFYEFFSAEKIAKSADSVEGVADEILRAYKADTTTVVPELLIQAYEFYRDRGATKAFRELINRNGSAELSLRLMSTNLQRHVRKSAFDRILTSWGSAKIAPRGEFALARDLPPDATDQLIADYLNDASWQSARVAFDCCAYAIASCGEGGEALQAFGGYSAKYLPSLPGPIQALLDRIVGRTLSPTDILPLFCTVVDERVMTWGPYLLSVFGVADLGLRDDDLQYISGFLEKAWSSRPGLNSRLVAALHDAYDEPELVPVCGPGREHLAALAGWYILLVEAGVDRCRFLRWLDVQDWFDPTQLRHAREMAVSGAGFVSVSDDAPDWVKLWARSRRPLMGSRMLSGQDRALAQRLALVGGMQVTLDGPKGGVSRATTKSQY